MCAPSLTLLLRTTQRQTTRFSSTSAFPVIFTRATSTVRPPATIRSGVARASLAMHRSTTCSTEAVREHDRFGAAVAAGRRASSSPRIGPGGRGADGKAGARAESVSASMPQCAPAERVSNVTKSVGVKDGHQTQGLWLRPRRGRPQVLAAGQAPRNRGAATSTAGASARRGAVVGAAAASRRRVNRDTEVAWGIPAAFLLVRESGQHYLDTAFGGWGHFAGIPAKCPNATHHT